MSTEHIPQWVSNFAVFIDDWTGAERTRLLTRFGELLARGGLPNWARISMRTRRKALEIALPHDKHAVVQPVLDLIDCELRGETVPTKEWATRSWATRVEAALAAAVASLAAEAEAEASLAVPIVEEFLNAIESEWVSA